MSKFVVGVFGGVSKNERHERNLILESGEEIVVRLFTDDLSKCDLLSRIDGIIKSLNTIIDLSKNAIINSCGIDGIYEEKMKGYMEYVLIDCMGNGVDDFIGDFGKRFEEIAAADFAARLRLRSIQFSVEYRSVVLDYYYTERSDEVWAVNYDLDLNLIDMTCES
mgnify:CR=1 FL=1|jgi:hypothetical protein